IKLGQQDGDDINVATSEVSRHSDNIGAANDALPDLVFDPDSNQQRSSKAVDLDTLLGLTVSVDWMSFYRLRQKDLESIDKTEIERQNSLHEIVTSEGLYIHHLDVLRVLYRDKLSQARPPIIAEKSLPRFLQD